VVAQAAVPPFAGSAMDGYAVRSADTPGRLVVAGECAAGWPGARGSAPGEAWRISTGAPLPPGADAVVRQEDVRVEAGHVTVAAQVPPGADVRPPGEDLAAGAEVIPAGTVLAAHEAGVVAAAGHDAAWCTRRIRIALLVSGDELAPPGGELRAGEVYDSNRYAIAAQARAAGAAITEVASVGDDPAATRASVRRLLDGDGDPPDLLVTTGGLSVGPHDHLRPALREAGVREVVPRVAVRPGRPTWIGARGAQVVLAIPGTPAAASVCFHVLGRPLLGHADAWAETAPLAVPVRMRAGVVQLLRCRLGSAGVMPLDRQGSAALSSMAGARALAWVPAGAGELAAGSPVRVDRLP